MAKILITGGSGLLGRAISELLVKHGHEPRWLSREPGQWKGIRKFQWDVAKGYIDEAALEDADAVVHLAGAGIMDRRWSAAYKQEIIDSRIKSSALLYEAISGSTCDIKTLVGGSAVGYYGTAPGRRSCTEADPPGEDFLAETCLAWEKSYQPFMTSGLRTVIIRTGIVLGREGGAYKQMAPLFRLGLGAALAGGEQYFPWIHIKDLAGIIVHSLTHDNLSGAYNAVATEAVTNREFSERLAKSFHKPLWLPAIPGPLLRLALGERAITLTRGLNISNEKIKAAGFRFAYDRLDEALEALHR